MSFSDYAQSLWHVFSLFPTASGDTLFQMAEVHRQIQVQLEDVVSRRKTWWFIAKKVFLNIRSYIPFNKVL